MRFEVIHHAYLPPRHPVKLERPIRVRILNVGALQVYWETRKGRVRARKGRRRGKMGGRGEYLKSPPEEQEGTGRDGTTEGKMKEKEKERKIMEEEWMERARIRGEWRKRRKEGRRMRVYKNNTNEQNGEDKRITTPSKGSEEIDGGGGKEQNKGRKDKKRKGRE